MPKLKFALRQLILVVARDMILEPELYVDVTEALSAGRFHDALGPALRIVLRIGAGWTLAMLQQRKERKPGGSKSK